MKNFFQGVETRTHPWPAGRPDLHWHVLFDEDAVRSGVTDPYHGLTHQEGIEPVPPGWVHMTVLFPLKSAC